MKKDEYLTSLSILLGRFTIKLLPRCKYLQTNQLKYY